MLATIDARPTTHFLTWLQTAQSPVADVLRDRARFLADRWRRTQAGRRERGRQVARWLEQEISDAYMLRQHAETRSLLLRAAALNMLAQAPDAKLLDRHEIAEYISTNF